MSLPPQPPVPCWYRRLPSRAVPLKLFQALYRDEPSAFLYESLETHGGRGRYSFIGAKPRAVFQCHGNELELNVDGVAHRDTAPPLEALRRLIHVQSDAPPVAPFCGGAVGYLSYDTVRWCERIPDENPDDLGVPDAHFLFPQEVICFDHGDKVIHVLLYQEGGQRERLDEIKAALGAIGEGEQPRPALPDDDATAGPDASPFSDTPLKSNVTQAQFEHMVTRAKEYICAGDIFQVVVSQRFEFPLTTEPLRLYQALRLTNPSPYMYYLKLDDLHIAGSSPEMLVTLLGRKVVTRPLAGTRRRGRTPEEDEALARELRADKKEQAEHVMLVDLGRNDLGRVCDTGTVAAQSFMHVEKYSHVMHIVSTVTGRLREGLDGFDLLRACFPAGTVSGAPKIRAMEIIAGLERDRRGPYAGAVGYFGHDGDMDMCITIRTIVMADGRYHVQAGAGIVADSDPAREYEETLDKARALVKAVSIAEKGL
jgi:anthranilate synthase component 1